MPLVNMTGMLKEAKKGGYAVPMFDVVNSDMTRAIIKAAEEKRSPVIVAYEEPSEPLSPMTVFAPSMITEAEKASVPVAIHLDHARSVEYVQKAVDNGFTSVMMDSSDEPFDINVEKTRKVVEICKPKDITVESEIGHVGGNEGYAFNAISDEEWKAGYTIVGEAIEFVKQTDVDALAVAIGTVHGVYVREPRLNLERLRELNEAISIPLVLHGGSGLSEDDFRNAIRDGIAKVNIYTELITAAMKATKENADKEYFDICMAVQQAVGM
jgi:fructose-bisphosphate aldolase class II